MVKKILPVCLIAFIVWGASLTAASLAERLPADRVAFYAEVDVPSVLKAVDAGFTITDADAAQTVRVKLNEVREGVKALLATKDVKAKFLDVAEKSKLYFVVLALKEPIVTTHTFKRPKYDEETGEVIEGEFEEDSWTNTEQFQMSFIIETDENAAKDALAQIRSFFQREEENYVELEVEKGEMIGDPVMNYDGDEPVQTANMEMTIGRMDNLLVISDCQPKDLWGCLQSSPASKLSDSVLYKRYATAQAKPAAFCVSSLDGLIKKAEKEMVDEIKKLEAAAAENDEAWELEWKRSSYNQFLLMKKLFSLSAMKQAGAALTIVPSDNRIDTRMVASLAHSDSLSTLSQLILDSGKPLQVPSFAKDDMMAFMTRVDASAIYKVVLQTLREEAPETAAEFEMNAGQVQAMLGITLDELIALISGDLYVFIDLNEKEVDVNDWDVIEDENGESQWVQTTRKEMQVVPELTTYVGLNDAETSRQKLSTLFTTLSVNPMANELIKKRVFQGIDVFCVGQNVSQEDSFPDGMSAFAVVIVDRYVTIGSWEKITEIIGRMKADQGGDHKELAKAVSKNARSNALYVIPKPMIQKLQKFSEKELLNAEGVEGDGSVFDAALAQLEQEIPEMDEKEQIENIIKPLKDILKAMKTLEKKMQDQQPESVVVSGGRNGLFYEISSEFVNQKK